MRPFAVEQTLTISPQGSVRGHVAVECLPSDAKLHTQILHLRLRLAHGRLAQAHLSGRAGEGGERHALNGKKVARDLPREHRTHVYTATDEGSL
jgi:hypothetical protein